MNFENIFDFKLRTREKVDILSKKKKSIFTAFWNNYILKTYLYLFVRIITSNAEQRQMVDVAIKKSNLLKFFIPYLSNSS